MKFLSVAELVPSAGLLPIKEEDLRGWHSTDPFFKSIIEKCSRPETIIEVGSWKGASALHMATLTPSASIFCVDTWLGGVDHVLNGDKPENDLKRDAFGSPQLYHQFLYNVCSSIHAERIYPVQQSSQNGAHLLYKAGVIADLIYIDASHTYEDVYNDLCAYYSLAASGAIIAGDDFIDFPGVRLAVMRFAYERQLSLKVEPPSPFWWFRVP